MGGGGMSAAEEAIIAVLATCLAVGIIAALIWFLCLKKKDRPQWRYEKKPQRRRRDSSESYETTDSVVQSRDIKRYNRQHTRRVSDDDERVRRHTREVKPRKS